MPAPQTDRAIALEAAQAVEMHGTQVAAARALGIPRATLQSRLHAHDRYLAEDARQQPSGPEPAPPDVRDRIYELEAQLRTVRANTLTDEWVKRKIIGVSESMEAAEPPRWALAAPKTSKLPGVPTLFASDWHWGEVVYPEQIGGVNEFNLAIAHQRARALIERTVYLLTQHIVNPKYPGIVFALGGDMLSGDIHDELRETNEAPTMPALLDIFGVLCWAVKTLADRFGNVFVPCVTGNHGRNTRKPRAKSRNFTNFDWLLYQFLARAFADDKRVRFLIPDGPDARYRVYGHRFLLTHGDQFQGGDGMIGHYGPVLRGQKRKQSRNAAIGQEFDTMIHGHFHTYFPTGQIIGNGSLKGYDEYANSKNFAYEPAMQALWMNHYEHGITQHMPVFLDQRTAEHSESRWVTWADDRRAA